MSQAALTLCHSNNITQTISLLISPNFGTLVSVELRRLDFSVELRRLDFSVELRRLDFSVELRRQPACQNTSPKDVNDVIRSYIRTKISFASLRSSILCLRGCRSTRRQQAIVEPSTHPLLLRQTIRTRK